MTNTIECTLQQAILNCCIDNFTPENAQSLLLHPEFQNLIKPVVLTHFSENRRSYRGSIVANADELMRSALGILQIELNKGRKNGTVGFLNNWKKYSDSTLQNVSRLWIRHRLIGECNRSHNEGSIIRGEDGQLRRTRQFQSLTYTNEGSHLVEREIQVESIEDQLIHAEDIKLQNQIERLIEELPFLTVRTIQKHIEQSSEMKWSLFPKLNPTSVCKWMMSHPTGCLESTILHSLWNSSKFSQLDWYDWIHQLPSLQLELSEGLPYQKRKAKEYALVIIDKNASSVQDIRTHPRLHTIRESLRKNTNLTNSGVALVSLISILRMHGSTILGSRLHTVLSEHYIELSQLASNIDVQQSVDAFCQVHCRLGHPVRFSSLFSLVSQIRYGQDIHTLPKSKRDNIRRILLVANSIAQQISKQFDTLGLQVL